MTHFEESYVGRQVLYCGVSGVGKNWSEERKKRVLVIYGFENGYLQLKWRGEEFLKHFILVNQKSTGPGSGTTGDRFPLPRAPQRWNGSDC